MFQEGFAVSGKEFRSRQSVGVGVGEASVRRLPKRKRPPTESDSLFRTPGSKEKSAPGWTASLPLDIAQANGVPLHPEPDDCPKDQEGRDVDRQYFKRTHGHLREGRTN